MTTANCSICNQPINLFSLQAFGDVHEPLCQSCFLSGKSSHYEEDIDALKITIEENEERLEEIDLEMLDLMDQIKDLDEEKKKLLDDNKSIALEIDHLEMKQGGLS